MDDDLEAFLGRGGTGVLALARDDTPYATPVSYGYDPETREFTFRLGLSRDSEKRRFLELDGPLDARFVIYGQRDGEWQSVIARGDLLEVAVDDVTPELVETLRTSDPPLQEIWDDTGDVEFHLYRLEADSITGRRTH